MSDDIQRVPVKLAVAFSEGGTVRVCWANSNWITIEREHQKMLDEIRTSKQLWTLRYVDINMPYPVSRENKGDL